MQDNLTCVLCPFWYVVVSFDSFLLTDAGEVNGICLPICFFVAAG